MELEIKGEDPVVKKGDGEGPVKREKSKAEMEMMKRAMDKLKKSAIIKQVAGGREFKVRTQYDHCVVKAKMHRQYRIDPVVLILIIPPRARHSSVYHKRWSSVTLK